MINTHLRNLILEINVRFKVRVHGVTRSRTPGKDAVGNCTTPVTVPDRDNMNMRSWRKIESQGRQLFKLYLPRITERNGPICCYRVYMVKLPPQKTVGDLPPPEQIAIYSYQYAHSSSTVSAYVAEIFDSDKLSTEIFLGDGEASTGGAMCDKCYGLRPKPIPPVLHFVPEVHSTSAANTTTASASTTTATTPTTSTSSSSSSNSSNGTNSTTTANISTTASTIVTTTIDVKIDTTTAVPVVNSTTEAAKRRKREDSPAQRSSIDGSGESSLFTPYDGFLDETSNYTGFIEIIGMYNLQQNV